MTITNAAQGASGGADRPATSARHPLAPLTVDESATACAVASGAAGPDARIVYCAPVEPPKSQVTGWNGAPVPRRATVVVYEPSRRRTSMVTVALAERTVEAFVPLDDAEAQVLLEEWEINAEQVKADPGFREALARRGVTDLSRVQIDPWPASNFGLDVDASGRRLARAVAYVLTGPGDNAYAHPVENLVAILDRDSGEVVELQEGDPVPVPTRPGRYDAGSLRAAGELRELAPLEIIQPDGPGFDVDDDGALSWGPWRMRVSLHPIEGLVLHEIGYVEEDTGTSLSEHERSARRGRLRPIVYRASMCEMVVPYGSTAMNHWWKNAFDAGDIGLGKTVNSLTLGCDCLGEIVYLDAVQVDENGAASTLPNAICLHEEDYGILWKHADLAHGVSEVRRSRRLVVSSISTVGNYEYGFFWYFYLDGTIQAEVKLTGIIQTQATEPGVRVPYANPVTPELAGPHHQHLFNFRLDMNVDGPDNSVYEVDAVPVPAGPGNPYGNAFDAQSTLLGTETDAQRMAAPERNRHWKIVNSASSNACGEPVAYRLVPTHAGAPLLAQPEAAITGRAAFATRHLWVTPYHPEERRAAGDFPNQHPGGAGLPEWTGANRPVADTDIVLWHTVSATHFCRPEDFPVMPVEYVGFTLKPAGFFDRNPAIDLAPSDTGHCHT